MAFDGYAISAYDGPTPQGGLWNDLAAPPLLGEIRPDVVAEHRVSHEVAYGEAKTAADLGSSHTLRQFRAFAGAVGCGTVRLYVAVPRSSSRELDKTLRRTRLLGNPRVIRLHVPDVFLTIEREHG